MIGIDDFMSNVSVKKKSSSKKMTELVEMYQVVLFNDDVNTFDHVMDTLKRVFSYDEDMAYYITINTHQFGKCIAQVEEKDEAEKHTRELQNSELNAICEKI